ncbi:Hypothetical protein A7982_10173 [Minicystis rosea]|nr:Hypothetical protein A7982_10173 [Minicystis rosea]
MRHGRHWTDEARGCFDGIDYPRIAGHFRPRGATCARDQPSLPALQS